jgi:hypothetical protein
MTARILIDDEFLEECISVLKDCAGVSPAPVELNKILLEDNDILFDAAKWGTSDTEVRGRLVDLIVGQLAVAHRWPVNGDYLSDEQMNTFQEKVIAAALSREWYVRD